MSGKKTWQAKAGKSFDRYVCKIQILKVDSVLTTYPADSRNAFCEVCSNAIIAKYCMLEKHN